MSEPITETKPDSAPFQSSAAFEQALLHSERRRILGVIVFVTIFVSAMTLRIVIYGSKMSPWGILVSLALIGYEVAVLGLVQRALKHTHNLPRYIWLTSILLETAYPALGLAFFTSPRIEFAYRPLATPWILAFFPFLILSTLRLNPWISRVAGIVASLSYLAAASYLGWRPSLHDPLTHTTTQTAVGFYAIILLASGIVAGAVSSEIRKHVQAALREVETRNRLERVEHDLGIARAIQQSLLPHIRPTMNGFEIAGWNHPADETGGDYFDWKHMPDGRLAVMLADVTGHGIGPAMLASECRAYARASFSNHDSLQGTFQRINESLEDDLAPNRFATFVAVVCKENNGEVELLSAGHGPLFIYSSETKTLRELSAQAVPFGILPTMVFEDTVILHLSPGDIVLLITDGFFEWENAAGEAFGVARLGDTVRESSHFPPEEIIAELYNRVLAFAKGTRQNDDLTAVVIKRVLPNAPSSTDAKQSSVLVS